MLIQGVKERSKKMPPVPTWDIADRAMATIRDKSKKAEELQLMLNTQGTAVQFKAQKWLDETSHREGCQCHRCFWAHGVIAGRIEVGFEDWRKR